MAPGGMDNTRLLIDALACERRIALTVDDRLARVWIDRGGPARFDIHLGRVTRILPELAGAMVALDGVADGLLPLDRIDSPLHEGQWVLVQVSRLGFEDKGPKLTGRIAIEGLGMILRPSGHKTGSPIELPGRLKDTGHRQMLETLLGGAIEPGESIALRSIAAQWDAPAIIGELRQLRAIWQRAQNAARDPKRPVLVFRALSDADQMIERHIMAGGACVVDGADEFVRLRGMLQARGIDPAGLARHGGPGLLFDDADIEDDLAAALGPRVDIPGGGWLAIEPATALCAIDVNAAGADAGQGAMIRAEQVNLRAAPEIVRQLQLRNIGGLVVIDPLRMAGKAGRDRFEAALRDSFGGEMDGAVQFGGFTRLGLFELSRQRGGTALSDLMVERSAHAGMASRDGALNHVVRHVIGELRRGSGGRYRLYVARMLLPALAAQGDARNKLETAMGGAMEIHGDDGLARDDYRLEKL